MQYNPKPKFIERINLLLNNNKDSEKFFEVAKTRPRKSIRVNTLKIKPEELVKKLKQKNWEIKQPFKEYPEIIIIESEIEPGELGNSEEHRLGYYYAQEITSMMPVIALNPEPGDVHLDLCASPGSKTTQAGMMMENGGGIIANDSLKGRISILCSNLDRSGVSNAVVIREDGVGLCKKLKEKGFKFDKILLDPSCSGEGTIRTCPKTFLEWSEGNIKSLSKKQKRLIVVAFDLLKEGGEMVYSTCTYAPEENEEVVEHLLGCQEDVEVVEVKLPLKVCQGILEWKGKRYREDLKKAVRIYHHDNDLEGFFLCKLRKVGK